MISKEESDVIIKEENNYKPPSRYGLCNSEPIIPSYYFKKLKGILFDKELEIIYTDIDYLTIIKDDIRNYRKLNNYQIDYIKHTNNSIKNEIIDEFIKVTNAAIDIINHS
jgi:hypothetical protein